jgi:hypothetical protein
MANQAGGGAQAPLPPDRSPIFEAAIEQEVQKRHYRLKFGRFAVGAEAFREGARWAFAFQPCSAASYLNLAILQARARTNGDPREVRRLGVLLRQIERAWKQTG